jgi:predicted DCC family thiol-disulfide oxidoreductase YuxK
VDWEVWAVAPDGTQRSGAAAINRVLQTLGSEWAWMAAAYKLAPIRWIEERAYRWIADHRIWLSRWIGASPEWKE